jgi:hypothetical protein
MKSKKQRTCKTYGMKIGLANWAPTLGLCAIVRITWRRSSYHELGGGTKISDPFTGQPTRVLAVKGSGGDIGSITNWLRPASTWIVSNI